MFESRVSVERVATHLGVSTDSIYRWIAHRGMPAFIVPVEDFEPFIEKFMAEAEALYAEWPLAT